MLLDTNTHPHFVLLSSTSPPSTLHPVFPPLSVLSFLLHLLASRVKSFICHLSLSQGSSHLSTNWIKRRKECKHVIKKNHNPTYSLSSSIILGTVRLHPRLSPRPLSFCLLLPTHLLQIAPPSSTPPPLSLLPTGYQSESITPTIPAAVVSEFTGTSSNWETVSLLH